MNLEEKLLELRTPKFTNEVRLAKWYAKNIDSLVSGEGKKPPVNKVVAALSGLHKIPKKRQACF